MARSRTYKRYLIIMVLTLLATTSHARFGDRTLPADLFLSSPTVPSSPSGSGTTGQISWDSQYIYWYTGSIWRRAAYDVAWGITEDVLLLNDGTSKLLLSDGVSFLLIRP